jgi:Ulp1 family protease
MGFSIPTIWGNNIQLNHQDLDELASGDSISDKIIDAVFTGVIPSMSEWKENLVLPVPHHVVTNLFANPVSILDSFTKLEGQVIFGTDIFSFNEVLLPLHVSGHWILINISMKNRSISYYDPLNISLINDHYLQVVKTFLEIQWNRSYPPHRHEDFSSWSVSRQRFGLPQINTVDCGIYLMSRVLHLCNGKQVDFCEKEMTSENIKELRTSMHNNLVKGVVLTNFLEPLQLDYSTFAEKYSKEMEETYLQRIKATLLLIYKEIEKPLPEIESFENFLSGRNLGLLELPQPELSSTWRRGMEYQIL